MKKEKIQADYLYSRAINKPPPATTMMGLPSSPTWSVSSGHKEIEEYGLYPIPDLYHTKICFSLKSHAKSISIVLLAGLLACLPDSCLSQAGLKLLNPLPQTPKC